MKRDPTFPVAQVVPTKGPWYKQVSRMWIVTAVCMALAIGLTWYSIEAPGPTITIRFPDGHGLKPGDVLRHRGMDIGEVHKIELSESLDNVVVRAELAPSAAAIACEGTRFWIVRPQLDLTGIRGLETAVGAKYIAVVPGDSHRKQLQFDGLGSPPPDGLRQAGVEFVLRGEQRFGVSPGSPLTWRGIEVGVVLSSGLSPDARHVDTRVQVYDAYRRLVSRNSKFWVTSGFQFALGMKGVELTADSLASIARGGIALITPEPVSDEVRVQPGDVFTLYEQADQDWMDSASAVNLMSRPLPAVGRVQANWEQKRFGFRHDVEATASAMLLDDDGSGFVVFPSDLAVVPEHAIEGTFRVHYASAAGEGAVIELPPITQHPPNTEQAPTTGQAPKKEQARESISKMPIDLPSEEKDTRVSVDRLRIPVSPEDCFAVRSSWHSEGESAIVIEMIGRNELRTENDLWLVDNSNLNREVWHGALVIASSDESVIGMIVVAADIPTIVPLSSLHFPD